MADDPQIIITEGAPDEPISSGIAVPRTYDASDKLLIINQALINTGNNQVDVPDDGSDEWKVASSAFDQWVPILLYRRDWKFASRIIHLKRVGDSLYPGFSDVYDKPQDCLFLHNVYRTDLAQMVLPSLAYVMPDDDVRPPDLEYRIVGDQIHCVGPFGCTAIYTPFPVGSQPWSIGFMAAVRFYVESACYRSLNEDYAQARDREQAAEMALSEAVSRCDSEEPRRTMFRSSILERRRRRGMGYWP